MVLDISADDLRRDLVTYRTSKIAIFPELSAPETTFDPGELTEEGPGTQALAPGHDLRDGVPRREGAEDMDMIWTHLHLFNGDVIWLRNVGKKLPDPLLDLPLQDVSAVLG
jgi:hypothetical protein